jgi:UDP-2-acetamido-3-amino-2,3-dideoxy-glucuronate N-acetyltransferase
MAEEYRCRLHIEMPPAKIHPTAIVDDGATVGEDSRVWHWVHISAGARVGNRCSLGQNVYVAGKAVIGNNVKIQNNVSIYDGVTLEDDVFCGPSMVFTNVINPRSHVVRRDEYRPTLVKRGSSIGANATIVCGVTLGAYSMVGAGAVVTKDVPDYALVTGVPARFLAWICECGVTLSSSHRNPWACQACSKRYAIHDHTIRRLD